MQKNNARLPPPRPDAVLVKGRGGEACEAPLGGAAGDGVYGARGVEGDEPGLTHPAVV